MLKPLHYVKRFVVVACLLMPTANAVGVQAEPIAPQAEQATTARGVVKDEMGDPFIGATIFVVGSNNKGGGTDLDGNFSIVDVAKGSKLKISAIGYKPVEVIWDGTPIDVQLELSSQQLQEIVVTAMGIQRKEASLTYATQVIKSDDLMKVQDSNFVNALSGKVSGVSITQSAGGAGGTSKILIRGNKSVMGNNSPLIVVDGVPMTNQVGNAASSWSDGSGLTYSNSSEGGDALSLINPDDIESINVLKGANAAALYGSAAANGVLMITTKKGKEGKISISVNSNVTFEKALTKPKIQNVYGAALNLAAGTLTPESWGKKVTDMTPEELAYTGAKLRNYAKDDIVDFFETGVTWNNSVSMSGGTEKVRTYFSYANAHSDGMVPNNTYNRNTLSLRQSYSLFNNKLNIDVSLNYVYARNRNRPGGGTVLNPLYDLYLASRNVDMDYYRTNYVADGTWTSNNHTYFNKAGNRVSGTTELSGPRQQWAYFTAGHNNPYWLVNQNRGQSVEERAYGSVSARYEVFDGLSLQGRLNMDRSKFKGFTNRYATTWNVASMEDYGVYGQDIISSNDVYVDVMASYNKGYGDYDVSASLGWSGHTTKGETQKIWTSATYYNAGSMTQLPTIVNFFEPDAGWNGNGTTYSKQSNWDKGLFFTGQVGWKEMVYVEGSYRQDWYRAFRQFTDRGTPDNYGYWSIGANTLVHKYAHLPAVITHLKLRASYSEVGNSIPNLFFAKGTTDLSTGAISGSGYGYFDNPRPEKSKSFEAGFDISMFRNALNWDLTYYHTDLTNSYFVSATTGGKAKPVNTGLIRNQGIETTLTYDIVSNHDWKWKSGINFTFNANKIVKTYTDDRGNPAKMEQKIANGHVVVRYEKGGSYGDMYALDFKRNADGSIAFTKAGVPQLSTDQYVYLGNMNSKYNIGWSNTVSWKDLSLYFLISGRIGGKTMSITEAYLDNYGVSQRTGDARLAAEAGNIMWTATDGTQKPGMMVDGQVVPVEEYYKTVGGQVFATEYVYNATNFRLAELSLSYGWRNLIGGFIKNLQLSVVGRNLFFIYKDAPVDPDISLSTKNGLGAFDVFNMPSTRSVGVNLKLEF